MIEFDNWHFLIKKGLSFATALLIKMPNKPFYLFSINASNEYLPEPKNKMPK